jgi:hypothetical protein
VKALPPDYLIQQRRKDEESRRDMLQTTQYYAMSSLQSAFEQSSSVISAENRIRRRYAELKQQEDQKLDVRRERYIISLWDGFLNSVYRHLLGYQTP